MIFPSVNTFGSKLLLPGILAKPWVLGLSSAAAGGGAAGGIVLVETRNSYPVSNSIQTLGSSILSFLIKAGQGDSSNSTDGTTAIFSLISTFFTNAYFSTSAQLQKVSQSVTSSLHWIISNSNVITKENMEEALKLLKSLHSSIGKFHDFQTLFRDIHIKLPQFISFVTDSNQNSQLLALFGGDKIPKTKEVLKVLAGSKDTPKNIFEVEDGLAIYLVNELIKRPKEVSEKLNRLVDLIDKAKQKNGSGAAQSESGGGHGAPRSQGLYKLTKKKLGNFLEKRGDWAQDGWEMGWLLEVGAHQKGIPLGSAPSAIASTIFTNFDKLMELFK